MCYAYSMTNNETPKMYRVTFVNSGGRRSSVTVTEDTKNWYLRATHNGIRVTKVRAATEKEIAVRQKANR